MKKHQSGTVEIVEEEIGMENFQLGTGKVAGRGETVVVSCKDKIIDLLKVLNGSDFNDQLQEANLEIPNSLMDILNNWEKWNTILPKIVDAIMSKNSEDVLLNEQDIQWLSPVTNPRKILCIGQNYKDHMEEMGTKTMPLRPYSFIKPVTTLIGSENDVELPKHTEKVDYEAELGVIIGKKVRHVKGQAALDCIAGYTVINDLSARDWVGEPSLVGTDWVIQKAYDGFLPVGPLMTPKQFISDHQNLPISLTVNGVTRQNSNTSKMYFSVQEIIEHLSSVMTLEPGDLIATGTPAGVAHGRKSGYLKEGDLVEVKIEGLGTLTTKMV